MKHEGNTKGVSRDYKRILKLVGLGALIIMGLVATITGAHYGIKRCKEPTSSTLTSETGIPFTDFSTNDFTLNKTLPYKKPQKEFYSLENLPKIKNATFTREKRNKTLTF